MGVFRGVPGFNPLPKRNRNAPKIQPTHSTFCLVTSLNLSHFQIISTAVVFIYDEFNYDSAVALTHWLFHVACLSCKNFCNL